MAGKVEGRGLRNRMIVVTSSEGRGGGDKNLAVAT